MQKELKFHDASTSTTLSAFGGIDLELMVIGQGAGESERIGRQVNIHSIAVSGRMSVGDNTVDRTIYNRLTLVMDRQANGALPTYADIYKDGSGVSAPFDYPNLNNGKRFKILKEWNRASQPTAGVLATAVLWSQPRFDDVIPIGAANGIAVEYNALFDDGRVGTLESVNFFLVGSTSESSAVNLSVNVRVRYTD